MSSAILPHLYQAVAEGAMFGIVVFDKFSGECLFVNRMAIAQLGTEKPSVQSLIPAAERPPFKSFSEQLLAYDGLYHDIVINNAEGDAFIGNLGVRVLEVDGHTTYLLMIQDVTVQKKLQREIMNKQTEIKAAFEELLKQNRQLRDLDLAKDRFIALTTHELRTPLSAMVASSEILKLGLYDSPEQMREFVDMIYEQGLHLQELVNDILDFAKIQAGKMDIYLELEDPIEQSEKIFNSFDSMAATNNIILKFEPPAKPMRCYFDTLRFRQVLSNIVNNAIKYNRPGGFVRLFFEEDDEIVRILIEDTGPGISADQYQKVFSEFETLGKFETHHKGTGLGMPISRKLVEGMGGKLMLSSVVGQGSVFWVELPKKMVLDASLYRSRAAAA